MANMAPWWAPRSGFWTSMARESNAIFLAGVFVLFFTGGLLSDILHLGAASWLKLIWLCCLAGGLAVAYVLVIRLGRAHWIILLVVLHALLAAKFDQIFGPFGPPLTGKALQTRLGMDVFATTIAMIVSFILLSHLIRIEATRYGRIHAEMSLARDIHRRLVPQIAERVCGFEFRGVSLASGEVGGDLIDLVESSGGWTSLVADVSGHGVAAGLLMGMVKSAARVQLRQGDQLDTLLTTLNAVLYELKSPTMFVTFVALQGTGDSNLRFTVAGHLPILHYRFATSEVVELSIAQLPLALFSDTSYTSSNVPCAAGDLFVLLTDGLTEVFDGADQEFGLDRVKALMREEARGPLERLEARLLEAVHAHGLQLDDQTMLLIRREA